MCSMKVRAGDAFPVSFRAAVYPTGALTRNITRRVSPRTLIVAQINAIDNTFTDLYFKGSQELGPNMMLWPGLRQLSSLAARHQIIRSLAWLIAVVIRDGLR